VAGFTQPLLSQLSIFSHSPNYFSACVGSSDLPKGAEVLQSCLKPFLHLRFSVCLVRLPHLMGDKTWLNVGELNSLLWKEVDSASCDSESALLKNLKMVGHKYSALPVWGVPVHRQSRRWTGVFTLF